MKYYIIVLILIFTSCQENPRTIQPDDVLREPVIEMIVSKSRTDSLIEKLDSIDIEQTTKTVNYMKDSLKKVNRQLQLQKVQMNNMKHVIDIQRQIPTDTVIIIKMQKLPSHEIKSNLNEKQIVSPDSSN